MTLYAPDADAVRAVARTAVLRNTHERARPELLEKLHDAPTDWDDRSVLSVPGLVWTASSDTCGTGRLSAPDNVAYDGGYRSSSSVSPATPRTWPRS